MKKPLLLFSLLISGVASAKYLESKDFLLSTSAGLIHYNFHLQGEYALAEEVTVGGFFGFYKDREIVNTAKGAVAGVIKQEVNVFGLRGSYHFVNQDRFNIYAGLDAGIEFYAESGQTRLDSDQYKKNQSVYGGHLGVRYALSNSFALLTEIGYINVPSLKLGATFTFNLQ